MFLPVSFKTKNLVLILVRLKNESENNIISIGLNIKSGGIAFGFFCFRV